MTRLRFAMAIAVLALLVGDAARAQTVRRGAADIGQLIAPPLDAEIESPPNTYRPAENNTIVPPVGGLRTTSARGNAEIFLFNEALTLTGEQNLAVLGGTHVQFERTPDKETIRYTLLSGTVRWVGRGLEVTFKSGGANTHAVGTAFIVRYDPAIHTTEVVGISGYAVVGSDGTLDTVTVGPQERTRVVDGFPPERRIKLSAAEMRGYVRPFELMDGGKSGSQVVDDPVVIGTGVPQPDRAPVGTAPKPAADDERRERGPWFHDPLPVVGATDLGINF
jgi:hypothetical protein